MDLVIDTSALLAVLLDEPERPALVQATVGAALVAPASLPWEIGNTLSALTRRGRLTGKRAREVWSVYEKVAIRLLEVSIPRSLQIAEELRIYAYDAYVLEVARAQSAPLVTLDKGLIAAALRMGVQTLEIRS
ncbi:MAG: type II toxin-antitoxin system VapC family toxin [Acidobacteria bacterium]|nr:type II toxin-antitoxin system VapC family toxin [Acidobacteriota bacterium]